MYRTRRRVVLYLVFLTTAVLIYKCCFAAELCRRYVAFFFLPVILLNVALHHILQYDDTALFLLNILCLLLLGVNRSGKRKKNMTRIISYEKKRGLRVFVTGVASDGIITSRSPLLLLTFTTHAY